MLTDSVIPEITQNPALNEFLVAFGKGEYLCMEGDESKDLYILLSGKLALYKGDKKITEVAEVGTPIGEISFLLKTKRTATVKAISPVETIRIPQAKLERFLKEFPAFMWHISEVLARRLDAGTQAWHALKEFCDSVPDALIAAEKDGRLITWNRSAEMVFGRNWEQMKAGTIDALYQEPDRFRQSLSDLEQSEVVKEKLFEINHPREGLRYVSTSLNFLYDGRHNISGVLALSRDVTDLEKIRRNYRRLRVWMLPLLIAVAIVAGASFFAVPYFKDRHRISDIQNQALRDRIGNDYILLQSLTSAALAERDTPTIHRVINEFGRLRRESTDPYLGLVILNDDKRVVAAYSIREQRIKPEMVGSSYADISFEPLQNSSHRVLSLYWSNERTGFGQKAIELAFEIKHDDRLAGWLIFQMNMEILTREYAVDEAVLRRYAF
jgi:PAS domain S-box-containing protein